MAISKIPGLNENLMKQAMKQYQPNIQRPQTPNLAEDEYKAFKKISSPAMKKMLWPSVIATTLFDPMYAGPMMSKMGIKSGIVDSAFSAIGGLGYLLPQMLSQGLRTRRQGYERQFASQLGGVGKGARAFEAISTARYLMKLPGVVQQLFGGGTGILKHSPRPEHLLTGTTGNVILGKGSGAVSGGGLLNKGYETTKWIGDLLTGGHISGALASGTKKGGIAGAMSSGVGMLDKGISSLLSSPLGLVMGMTGAQIGLSIWKSVKLAKIIPKKHSPDKLGQKYFGMDTSGPVMQRILQLAGTGKVDPQTLSFMALQVIEGDIRKSNMLLAGLRGEIASESDFLRQEKEKGEKGFGEKYGTNILDEDDRGIISKSLDTIERTLSTIKTKYDPFTQLTNFAFGLLRGKIVLPRQETSKIAKLYGYDDEKKMMKEKAASFGANFDQTRLIHIPSSRIKDMALTTEAKQIALASAIFDTSRFMLAELMTIRISGFGIEQNILHRKEPGKFKQFFSDILGKVFNLPGLNALGNILKVAGKAVTFLPNKIFELGGKALSGTRDYLLGESYKKLQDQTEFAKAAGLHIPVAEKAQDYIANGLPQQLERIRSILYNIYYVNDEMLRLEGGSATREDEMQVWSATEKRYLTAESNEIVEEGHKLALKAIRDKAFREGPLGKILLLGNFLNVFSKKSLKERMSIAESMERMQKYERRISGWETKITGEPVTFETERAATSILGDISSIKTKHATPTISIEELESELALQSLPGQLGWQMGATAATTASGVLAILLGMPIGGAEFLVGGGAYAAARAWRQKKIKEDRENEIKTRSGTERIIELQEEYFKQTHAERMNLENVIRRHPLNRTSEILVKGTTNEKLDLIASYLGDDKGSVYELLSPGHRYAEVTVIGKPIDEDKKISEIHKKPLELEFRQEKELQKEKSELTFSEKLEALDDKMKEKEEKLWQNKVVTLLGSLDINKKDRKVIKDAKDGGGLFSFISGFIKSGIDAIFSPIWNFIKNNIGKVIGGTLLAKLLFGGSTEASTGEDSLVDQLRNNVYSYLMNQISELSPAGKIGAAVVTGATVGMVGGIPGMLKGALLGLIVGGVGIALFEFMNIMKTDGFNEAMHQFIMGAKEGGLISAIKTMGQYSISGALIGGSIGLASGGVLSIPGIIGGAIIGAAMGGVIGWLGQFKISNMIDEVQNFWMEFSPNAAIIKLFTGPGLKYAPEYARAFASIPIVGPIIGGMIGYIKDFAVFLSESFVGLISKGVSLLTGLLNIPSSSTVKKYNEYLSGEWMPESGEGGGGKSLDFPTEMVAKTSHFGTQVWTGIHRTGGQIYDYLLGDARNEMIAENTVARESKLAEQRKWLPFKKGDAPSTTITPSAGVIPPSNIGQILLNASNATGVPFDIMSKIAYVESSFNPHATAKSSTAAGLFQFVTDTWKYITEKKGDKYGINPHTSRLDPNSNALMGGEYIKDNIREIQGHTLTSPPTEADIYAAHFLGAAGARQLFRKLKSTPDGIAADEFKKAAHSNPTIFYQDGDKSKPRTFRQIYEYCAMKMRVDPSTALAKAGTFISDKFSGILSTGKQTVVDFIGSNKTAGSVIETSKDVISILGEAFGEIQKELYKGFGGFGGKKDTIGQVINPTVEAAALKEIKDIQSSQDIIKEQERQTVKKQTLAQEKREEERIQEKKKSEVVGPLIQKPQSLPIERNAMGVTITDSFDRTLERIFGSLDSSLISVTTKYPFESKMQHSYY